MKNYSPSLNYLLNQWQYDISMCFFHSLQVETLSDSQEQGLFTSSATSVFSRPSTADLIPEVKKQNVLIWKHQRQLWKFAFLFWHLIAGQEKHTNPLKCAPFLLHTHKEKKQKQNKVKRTVFILSMNLSSVSHNIINQMSNYWKVILHFHPAGWEEKKKKN